MAETTGVSRDQPTETRVLHVDDDPAIVDLTAAFLTRFDDSFSVYTSTDAEAALERIEGEQIDCVVSDYEMPKMDGLELLERVREFDPDVPFILFTGRGSEEIASKAISAGVTDYLQKETGTEQYTVLANRIENAVEQTRSQRALAESEKRLSRLFDQSPLGMIEYDETFTVVRVNHAATEITGYDAEELVGGTWLPIVPEELHRHVAEVERQLLADRGGYQSVNELVRKDGERRLCAWHNRVVTDGDGEIITIFSQFEDITEERRQREALEQTNILRSTLFETLPVGVLAEDSDRNVLRINDRLLELFDISADLDDVIGSDCEAFAEEISTLFENPAGFVSRIEKLIDSREAVWNDELVLADGRAFERNYRPIELPDGPGHLWVYYDITERKRREQRLEALNETARELMTAESCTEVADIGVDAAETVLELDANVINFYEEGTGLVPVAYSETATELVGELPAFSTGEGIAWRVYEQGTPQSVEDVQSDPDVYNPDTNIRSELYIPLDEYGLLIAGSPTPDAFDAEDVVLGEILGINIVTALEQVQRNERIRERERELTRQNARLEEFASVVSHDLRNPLNVAEGRLELAAEECDSEQLEYVADAHDRMIELIDDLLTLARDRDTDIDPTPVSIGSFVESCWQNVETGDADLAVDVDGVISADETQLRQLLENLLRNAIEHGGGAVRVGCVPGGFYVEDDGPGIPADEREQVFEYGYSTTQGGTGFGLSIVQQCAASHGWEIRATESDSGGARFEVTGVDLAEE
ncbi:hybrid sensor histidine kinase/response regulator [Halobellus captivus]|uniref:hybrid sensor histidine kinase/response regulator n=1 Tax=Halobellus captivus TaxID=2592614 RepID=UPI0011A19B1F|nr:PAS domain S-box protein [Halobellus captivus]